MPPTKVSDVPLANPNIPRDYRAYKMQFQAPPNVQTFNWKLCVISDTFIGEDAIRDVSVSIPELCYSVRTLSPSLVENRGGEGRKS